MLLEGVDGDWVQGAGFLVEGVGSFFTFFLLLAIWPFCILHVYSNAPFSKHF